MNKSELVEIVTKHTHATKGATDDAIHTALAVIKDALASGQKVELAGFGSFKPKVTKAHLGHNPRTGDKIQIPDKSGVKFTPSKMLIDMMN